MPIKVKAIEIIPMMEGEQLVNETFATLEITHRGTCVAAVRLPIDEMPDEAEVGDVLRLVKSE